jgi:hypothetical protein
MQPTRKGDPLPPPKRSVYFVNTPPDFFHPYSPHTPLPRQNSWSPFANREHFPVSPLINGQISGQLLRLSPRPAVSFPATTGLAPPAKIPAKAPGLRSPGHWYLGSTYGLL